MKLLTLPTFDPTATVVPVDEPTDHRGRIAIAVQCETCRGWTRYENDGKHCPDCDGLGDLIVATADVVGCVPPEHQCSTCGIDHQPPPHTFRLVLIDVQPVADRPPIPVAAQLGWGEWTP